MGGALGVGLSGDGGGVSGGVMEPLQGNTSTQWRIHRSPGTASKWASRLNNRGDDDGRECKEAAQFFPVARLLAATSEARQPFTKHRAADLQPIRFREHLQTDRISTFVPHIGVCIEGDGSHGCIPAGIIHTKVRGPPA